MQHPSSQQPIDKRAVLFAALSSLILFLLCMLAYHYWPQPAAAPPVVVADFASPQATPEKAAAIGAGGGQSATGGSGGGAGNGTGRSAASNAGNGSHGPAGAGNTASGNGTMAITLPEPPPQAQAAPATASPTPAPPSPVPTERPKVITRQIGIITAMPQPPLQAGSGGPGREPVLGTGDVQITLRWRGAPDVDLHVTDPSGERIWFEHRSSRSGGMLDVDDTDFDGPENIFWPKGGAPTGEYSVAVNLYNGDSAQWQVRVLVDGKEQNFSNRLTQHGQTQEVAKFKR